MREDDLKREQDIDEQRKAALRSAERKKTVATLQQVGQTVTIMPVEDENGSEINMPDDVDENKDLVFAKSIDCSQSSVQKP